MKRDLLIFQGAMILFVAVMLTLAGNYIYKKEMLRSRMGYITELQRQLAHSFEVKIQSVDDDALPILHYRFCRKHQRLKIVFTQKIKKPKSIVSRLYVIFLMLMRKFMVII